MTLGASPPLAVGLPVYNGDPYLAQAIESILEQTYGDFQLIISDNASTDDTEEICRAYAARDSRILYDRLERNRGAAHNFNRVFLMGRSRYFKFAAADDMCSPEFFQLCMDAYGEAPDDVVLCFPQTIKIDSAGSYGGIIEEKMDLRQLWPHTRFAAFLRNYWLANCFYGVLRSEAYASTRMHGSYDAADIVLLSELALRGQFWQLGEPLFLRRFHTGMSHKRHTTSDAIRQFYDSSKMGARAFPKTRMFWEFLRGINSAGLGYSDRLRCHKVFFKIWVRKYAKTMAREAAEGAGVPISRWRRRHSSASSSY